MGSYCFLHMPGGAVVDQRAVVEEVIGTKGNWVCEEVGLPRHL